MRRMIAPCIEAVNLTSAIDSNFQGVYPVYSVWDGYGYAFTSDTDSPSLVLTRGASWSYDFDFAHNRNGTGFIPRLEYGTGVFHPKLELGENPNRVDRRSNLMNPNRVDRESNLVSIIDALPSEVQEVILASLPLACIIESSLQIVHSGKFKIKNDIIFSKKPWYFMFTNSDEPTGCIYNHEQRRWYDFVFLFNLKDAWKIVASAGLICSLQENDCNYDIFICNPMTRECRKFEERLGAHESTNCNLAFSVDKSSNNYTVALVRSWQVQVSFSQWNISIHVYNSENMTWLLPYIETMVRNDSIIFYGVLYFVVTKIGTTNCHVLLSYNLKSLSSNCKLIKTLILIPLSLTCLRLMNLHNKIVMVRGLGTYDVPENIGIWMLKGTAWEEVSLVPGNFIRGFGELDDVFLSSGTGDFIYIQTFGSTSLLVFDMKLKVWKWCQKCPLPKKWDLQLFSGFCFEPRLDVSP